MRPGVLVVVALWTACEAPGPRTRALPITAGTPHTGHPAVGKLIFARTGGTKQDGACTATLVGRKTVLAAAHCLPYPLTAWVDDTGAVHASAKNVIHPSYVKDRPYEYDLGLVLLETAPTTAPATIARSVPVRGTPITMIGYGETQKGAGDNNVKRSAANVVDSVQPLYFTITGTSATTGNACYGDSGGPVYVTTGGQELVAGVLSYITGPCGTTTYATRLDLYTSWLLSTSSGDIDLVSPPRPDGGQSAIDAGPRDTTADRATAPPVGRQATGGCSVASAGGPGVVIPLMAWLAVLVLRTRARRPCAPRRARRRAVADRARVPSRTGNA